PAAWPAAPRHWCTGSRPRSRVRTGRRMLSPPHLTLGAQPVQAEAAHEVVAGRVLGDGPGGSLAAAGVPHVPHHAQDGHELDAGARVLGDLGGGAGEADTDLVDVELVHRPLDALTILVAALLQPPLDDDADAAGEGLGDVLGGLPPHRAGEGQGVAVAPLVRLL